MKTTFKTQAAQTAQLIRKDLKEFFPKAKFTVKSDSYAGGDAVRISFIDSPYLTAEVESKLKKYQYGHFNGMEDIYENSNSIDGLPQVKFVQVAPPLSLTACRKAPPTRSPWSAIRWKTPFPTTATSTAASARSTRKASSPTSRNTSTSNAKATDTSAATRSTANATWSPPARLSP